MRELFPRKKPSRAEFERHKKIVYSFRSASIMTIGLGRPLDLGLIAHIMYYHSSHLDDEQVEIAGICPIMIWWSAGVPSIGRYFLNKGEKIALQGSEQAMIEYKGHAAVAEEFLGNPLKGRKLTLEAYTEGSELMSPEEVSSCLITLSFNSFIRGHSLETIRVLEKHKKFIEENKISTFAPGLVAFLTIEYGFIGQVDDSSRMKDYFSKLTMDMDPEVRLGMMFQEMIDMFEKFEFRELEGIENNIERFYAMGSDDYYERIFYDYVGYIRLAQLQLSKTKDEKQSFKAKLIENMDKSKHFSRLPVFKCHALLFKACLERENGKYRKALNLLRSSLCIANSCRSYFGQYMAVLEMSRTHREMNDFISCQAYAREAFLICNNMGWKYRKEFLRKEFDFLEFNDESHYSTKKSSFNSGFLSLKSSGTTSTNRGYSALLKISLATSKQTSPKGVAVNALDEVVKIMNADRGIIFVIENKEPKYFAGRDRNYQSIEIPSGISSTVVHKVVTSKQYCLITHSKEAKAIGSESAVINDLRSILAVPILHQDKVKGVIYVDSTVSRGLFSEKDVELFESVAAQVALSFENARFMEMETEKKAMEKDLEVSAAIQKMFLPKHQSFNNPFVRGMGFYRPAAKCGGDWWYQKIFQDKLYLFIGDVTGHGVGPAMITSFLSTCFLIEERRETKREFPVLMREISNSLNDLAQDEFYVAGTGIELDLISKSLKVWGFGGCSVMHFKNDGSLNLLSPKGSLIGMKDFRYNLEEGIVEPGDRIVFTTDGILEQKRKSGRMLGEKKFVDFVKDVQLLNVEDAVSSLVAKVDTYRSEIPQDDDYTLLLLEILKGN